MLFSPYLALISEPQRACEGLLLNTFVERSVFILDVSVILKPYVIYFSLSFYLLYYFFDITYYEADCQRKTKNADKADSD